MFYSGAKKILSLLLLVAIMFIFRCSGNKDRGAEKETYASLDRSVKYVGMAECRQCHADIYESFSHTGMGMSFDFASKRKSSAIFEKQKPVYDPHKNFYYKPYWENDSLKILEFRLHRKDTVYKRIETVHYIIGSGQHTNSHIREENGYLHQAPLTFYTQKGTWDLPPGFEGGGNSRFSRIIGLECMTCHNGYPEFVLGSENKYGSVKNGIDCERCHGPGEKHVAEKRTGKTVDITKEIDYTIVNPSKLPVDLQFDVCQRCHIQGNAVLNEGKSFFDFRPGMHLSEVMNVFMPVWKGKEEEHIMASHAERLKMSSCFLQTKEKIKSEIHNGALRPYKNALTCITCHNPHVSVLKTEKNIFNDACKKCHSPEMKNDCSLKTKLLEKENFNCVKCHMPFSSSTDIPHVQVTDHFIRKPISETEIEKIKTFVGIACINNPAPSDFAKGNAFINYFEKSGFASFALDSAKKYFSDLTKEEIQRNFHALVHIYFLEKNYRQVVHYAEQWGEVLNHLKTKSYSNADAWTCYRVGEGYANTGNSKKAVEFYERAVELAPFNLDFQNVYASQLMEENEMGKAEQVLKFILNEFPGNAKALLNLGFLKLTVYGDTASARQNYEKALLLDPDYLQAWYNIAGLYIYRKDFSSAKKMLNEILRKNPEEEKAKMIIKNLPG